MRRLINILFLIIVAHLCACQHFDENAIEPSRKSASGSVETLPDGRLRVKGTLAGVGMTSTSVATRGEESIYDGWCLVFGEEEGVTGSSQATYDSPLLQKIPLKLNSDGTFYVTFTPYAHKAFMRIVVNFTDREEELLEDAVAWVDSGADGVLSTDEYGVEWLTKPTAGQVSTNGVATFADYRLQSVGLDGIYKGVDCATVDGSTEVDANGVESFVYNDKNTISPDPANVADAFPMASPGFVMPEITEKSVFKMFGTKVYMVRVCSKVDVTVSAPGFKLKEVYMVGCAQESRVRSTVLSESAESGSVMIDTLDMPHNLGGVIDYKPLEQKVTTGGTTSPIYIYPNWGGDYEFNNGVVNTEAKHNPQYVIIKGRAAGYDIDGYYKVALKAQYPRTYKHDAEGNLVTDANGNFIVDTYTDLTYDILRNTHFNINLQEVEKAGYKTLEDAKNPNNPAGNISYNITILSEDSRNEVLLSNGTFYAELETSRVYVKGYMDGGIDNCYVDFSVNPTKGNSFPNVYIQSSDFDGVDYDSEDVNVTHCLVMNEEDAAYATKDWDNSRRIDLTTNNTGDELSSKLVKIESNDLKTRIRVYFSAKASGRVRLRMGNILKFIPVVYDSAPLSIYGTRGAALVVQDTTTKQSWGRFSYSSINYDYSFADAANRVDDFKLEDDGTVSYQNTGNYTITPELRARVFSDRGDGNAVLYMRQANDFRLMNGTKLFNDKDAYVISYTANSTIWTKDLKDGGKYTSSNITTDSGNSNAVTFYSDGDVELMEVKTLDKTDYGTSINGKNFAAEDYLKTTYDTANDRVTLYSKAIDYDVNGAMTEFSSGFLLTEAEVRTTITLTNSAGDTKDYELDQILYPPVYLVSPSGTGAKPFDMYRGTWPNYKPDFVSVFALNIWNYDSSNSGYSWKSSWSVTGDVNDFKDLVVPVLLNYAYVKAYDWSGNRGKGISSSGQSVSGKDLNGDADTFDTIRELTSIGGNSKADAIISVVRSDDWGGLFDSAEATVIFTITDKFGEEYETTKKFSGV